MKRKNSIFNIFLGPGSLLGQFKEGMKIYSEERKRRLNKEAPLNPKTKKVT